MSEWKVQNLVLRQKWMQAVHPFSIDDTATALFHGDRGLIDGIVTYENGKPVSGATVSAEPMGRPLSSMIPHDVTNKSGRFAIEIVPDWFGQFAVTAKKENEDYPDMNQFYSGGRFETVTLTPHQRAATVAIRLGPRAGVLVGTIIEAATRVPLNACVELRRAKGIRNFLVRGLLAKYRVLVPSSTDVLMEVWDGKHKFWYYPGTIDEAKRLPLNLHPGETKKLDIQLVPVAQPNGCESAVDGTVPADTRRAVR